MDQDDCCGIGASPDDHDQQARFRLLMAAADVFDRKGYAAASVREIVEQAGITKPVLYYHYGSKEGILIAILEEGARIFEGALARVLAADGTTRDHLRALCDMMYTLFKQHTPAVRVAHAIYFGPREGLPTFDFDRFDRSLNGAVRSLVEQGMASGEIRRVPVEDVMLVINGAIAVCTDTQLNPRYADVGPDRIHRVLDLMFDGLRPTEETKEN